MGSLSFHALVLDVFGIEVDIVVFVGDVVGVAVDVAVDGIGVVAADADGGDGGGGVGVGIGAAGGVGVVRMVVVLVVFVGCWYWCWCWHCAAFTWEQSPQVCYPMPTYCNCTCRLTFSQVPDRW